MVRWRLFHVGHVLFVLLACSIYRSESVIKRCFNCRSRGELGSCKDEFKYENTTLLDNESGVGVEAIPCASGWCGKMIETSNHDLKTEVYGTATQRMCLQRSPSDNEERCDHTIRGYKKVFMCFCHGDLCNKSAPIILLTNSANLILVIQVSSLFFTYYLF